MARTTTGSAPMPLSRREAVTALPAAGRTLTITACPDERVAIAGHLGLHALAALDAVLTVTPGRRGVVHVSGDVTARVTQICVITLEPFDSVVTTAVAADFASEDARSPRMRERDAGEIERGLDDPDPPEPIVGGVIDLGALVVEFLDLALDPYPRKPGATLALAAPADRTLHPFQALSVLTAKKDGA